MFKLDDYLRTRRKAVDRALTQYLRKSRSHRSQAIWEAMRYGVFPGGKRIRPILMLAAGELFGGRHKDLLPFACAVEMIHAYSLIHDDLPALDNDDFRRGIPTAHKAFGEGMALLAGDALLTEAFRAMSAPAVTQSVRPEVVLGVVHELAHAAGVWGLVGGQAFDLEAQGREVDVAMVEYIHVRKTGALIHASVRLGARLAGAKPPDLKRVSRFGEYLGLAFQIADDILDVHGDRAAARDGSGPAEWKQATYPAVVGVVQAKERLEDLLQQAVRQLMPYGAQAEPLRGLTEYVCRRALAANTKARMHSPNQEM